ncbi:Uncharacterised protein [Mycobacteroides abscessus subsp. abscessus]|nr:Uncharacterised protein [Mycobacteroides abscessus subsp. abscessus]
MPCSQMMSMNCRPPRPTDASRFARLPRPKARFLNSRISSIGSATRASITQNSTSSATPAISDP